MSSDNLHHSNDTAEYIAGVNPGAMTFREAHGDSLLLRLSVMTVEAAGPISEAITEGIRVEVMSRYAPENARPGDENWLFEYTVRITNEGTETVQLLSRHWYITDALDHTREVEGAGCRGKTANTCSGRVIQVFFVVPAEDPDRHNARDLHDGTVDR